MPFKRHSSISQPSQLSPSPDVGVSGIAPDVRPVAEVVPKSAGGFEVEPSDYIVQVSRKAYMSWMSGSIMKRYDTEHAQVAQSTNRQLTLEESNSIWDALIDPPSRNRRYGFRNQEAMMIQPSYRRSQDEEEITQLKQQLAEINDW